jgi:hypothetical protein
MRLWQFSGCRYRSSVWLLYLPRSPPRRTRNALLTCLRAVRAGCNAGRRFSLSGRCLKRRHRRYGALLFGTCKRNMNGKSGMLRWLGLGFLLGTGLGSVAWAQGSAKFDGQYMGELTLTKVINGDCTQPPLGALYALKISRGEVQFVYLPRFGTTLSGKVGENGSFKASARLRRGFVQMTGRIQGNDITAYIVSPSCNYTFQTKN